MPENALRAMARRYLKKDADGGVVETPRQAMERVAEVVSLVERGRKKQWKDKFLEMLVSFEFVPAGCYFRGAGNKRNGSLASCFVLPVEDSIEQIFDAVKWSAQIHQLGGGTGFNFSHLRPRGDVVGSGGLSAGPVNFMRAFDAETEIVSQGGAHRGANMGILNVDHPDIFEFIRAKSIDGQVSNFNISVGVSDKFMKAVGKNGQWTLKNPRGGRSVQRILARDLWDQIVDMAHKTGDPGMVYLDTVNRVNPVMKALGPIEATNVCGEQPLHPFDVCNLGSVNLAKFVTRPWWEKEKTAGRQITGDEKSIKWSRLEEVIRLAVRFLDNGIDASTYPIEQIEKMAHQLRRVGLGVMGWADMLAKLGVRYDSEEGVKLAGKIMKFIQEISWDESQILAKEKGVFKLWSNSYFNSIKNPFRKRQRVRNVAVTTIAPTGTISMVADCSSGIEPYFALEYTKNVVEKTGLKYINRYYQEAKKTMAKRANEIFRTSHLISPEWHVKVQAAFQEYTDNAVSKTINFVESAKVKDIEKAYMMAWEAGCKGITVYRDRSRGEQVLLANSKRQIANGKTKKSSLELQAVSNKQIAKRLAQSQLQVTPLSQRAYQQERQQILETVTEDVCPECGAQMEMVEGCSMCRSCGFSKCST
jgi:ribonucleoside-diphosphate reductase alpha chain